MTKKILLLLVLLFSFSVFAETASPYSLTHKKIVVSGNYLSFPICLKSNPNTGSWKLVTYDNNRMKLLNHRYVPPSRSYFPGSPGYQEWIFKTDSLCKGCVTQVAHITFAYTPSTTKKSTVKAVFMIVVKK